MSPPQRAEPEERLNTTDSSRGLSKFNKCLLILKRNKDLVVGQPTRSHYPDPQSHLQLPASMNGFEDGCSTASASKYSRY